MELYINFSGISSGTYPIIEVVKKCVLKNVLVQEQA